MVDKKYRSSVWVAFREFSALFVSKMAFIDFSNLLPLGEHFQFETLSVPTPPRADVGLLLHSSGGRGARGLAPPDVLLIP
jgi:hypothetical protein